MSGTFASFNTALSALRHHRVAMDVASGNVANAGTEGYARRQVIGQATGAPSVPAMWSHWGIAGGDGVRSGPVSRMVDPLLDARSRTEHGTMSFNAARAASLVRFETTLGEPGDTGVAAALASFQQGWHDVANNPGDGAARSQLLARAHTLADTVRTQDRALSTEWSDQRSRLTALASEVTSVGGELADLNKSLLSAHINETDAGVLLDRRDQLALRMSQLTGADVEINADTTVTVTLGGQDLVKGNTALAVTVGGPTDLDGVTPTDRVHLVVAGNPDPVRIDVLKGEVGGVLAAMNTDLPEYRDGLDRFAGALISAVNTQHQAGWDRTGAPGQALLTGTGAGDLAVAALTPDQVAAAGPQRDANGNVVIDPVTNQPVRGGDLDNTNAINLANAIDGVASGYRELITGFGVTVSAATRAVENQSVIVAQVDGSREALSGISIDEEMVNLLAAQRAYEGAARVMTAIDSILDTLINRTGLR